MVLGDLIFRSLWGSGWRITSLAPPYQQEEDKGNLLGTPNREPQEYSRNIVEYEDPGRYIPNMYLQYTWGCLFGVPSRVPLEDELIEPVTRHGHSDNVHLVR